MVTVERLNVNLAFILINVKINANLVWKNNDVVILYCNLYGKAGLSS